MDFARKQLEKYGWSEGKGLGKHENGISTALKPKLKFDHAGVGHNVGEQFTNNWWEKLFNNAAENIDVKVDVNNEIKMKIKSEDAVEITTKTYNLKYLTSNKDLKYGSFLKVAKLTESGVEKYNCPKKVEENSIHSLQTLTDDELFAACGGRTAHKGARHGLRLNGKLSRIEKQERMLLKKMKKVSLSDINQINVNEKKLKKIKKQKGAHQEKYTPIVEDSMESVASNGLKKKKKRKSVSFNETVTKIYTVDLDTSFESEYGSARDENSNEPIPENIASGFDEGIEQDVENNNNLLDNHKSFEVAQVKLSDLSKAERNKLKKKRKLENKKYNQTGFFLQQLNDDIHKFEPIQDYEDKEVNLKKRKYYEDCDLGDNKRDHSFSESPERNKSKKNKKKRKTQKKLEEKQINSIAKSLNTVCRISESE